MSLPALSDAQLTSVVGGLSQRGAIVYGQRVMDQILRYRGVPGLGSNEPSPTVPPPPASPGV